MNVEHDFDLRSYNTFGVPARAKFFCAVSSEAEFIKLLETDVYKQNRVLIIGGGSNILFRGDFDGLVIKDDVRGIEPISQTDTKITVRIGAGENWHRFVVQCVNNNWGGIENLSLIPGTVGAAPMQNIGAYGVEIKDVLDVVDAIDRTSGTKRSFTRSECRFGYRDSIFKQELREKFFVSSVTLTLTKRNHALSMEYGAIRDTLRQMKVHQPTIESVSQAVIHIRRSKLPDPDVLGNAGSFFKNPVISADSYRSLKEEHPGMPGYFSDNQPVKVPAAWLIEQCGWKGKHYKNVGVHDRQPLVLVNYGNGNGDEIFELAMKLQLSVKEKFGIELTTEVNVI